MSATSNKKSLSEQVDEIKNANISSEAKVRELIKIGLTKYEVELICGEMPKQTRESHTFTFGVEIECLMAKSDLLREAARTGLPYRYESYNHTDNKSYYKFVSDASIRGNNPIECVSPVLKGKKGLENLKNCCATLNAAGAVVNSSTGLHVHIGAESLTEWAYCSVFVNYMHLETVIDTFMAKSRRESNSRWCHSLRRKIKQSIDKRIDMSYALNNDRYNKVNPCSYSRHKTIEFRQHQGTTDYEKISNWVNFCIKLVAYSKKKRLDNDITRIDDIPFLTAKEKAYFKNRATQLS